MIHLLETELQKNKSLYINLQKIYGINKNKASVICKKLGFSFNFKTENVSNEQKLSIVRLVEKLQFLINADLVKLKSVNNKRLINIKSYRGLRKLKGFPVRGQRTRSNAITSKKK